MAPYNQPRLQNEIAQLGSKGAATLKGMRLQNLMEWLLGAVPGVTVTLRNTLDAAKSDEKDLWLQHDPSVSGLPFSDVEVPVECKNTGRRASATDVRNFAAKIRNSGGVDGLLVSTMGLAGGPGEAAHQAVTQELTQRIRIVVLSGGDLAKLVLPKDLRTLIVDRRLELRVLQTYRSL